MVTYVISSKKLTWLYGDIRVVRVSDDLGGSSSRGRVCVVVKSAVVIAGGCSDEFLWL